VRASGGKSGADGIYTIEILYPLRDLKVDEVSFQFAEVTKYTAQGFYEISSYWISDSLCMSNVDLEFINNGGLEERIEGKGCALALK